MGRVVPILAVLSAVVLAGCGGYTAPAEPTSARETVTPALVPTEPPAETYPPGVGPDGVWDPSTLRRARAAALADVTYVERARTAVRANGRTVIERTLRSRHGTDADRLGLRLEGIDDTGGTGGSARPVIDAGVWTNGSYTVRRRVRASGETTYDAREYGSPLASEPQPGYVRALAAGETTVESRRVVNRTVRYTLVATGLDPAGPWYVDADSLWIREPGSARAVVSESGVVLSVTARFPVVLDGRRGTLRHAYRVERGPVTVPRPPWFPEALPGESTPAR
jgi:hypothetical protein